MAKLKVLKRVIIRDCNGIVEYDSGLLPSNSFVIADLEFIYGAFNDVNLNIGNTSNTEQLVQKPTAGSNPRMHGESGDDDDTYGIVVGTGTTAEINTDYALATQIAHGTGADQLDYGTHSFTPPAVVGSNVDMVVSRTFLNGSGGTITVREIGIYYRWATGAQYKFCIARDVLTTPAIVEDTKTLTVQYTYRTTV